MPSSSSHPDQTRNPSQPKVTPLVIAIIVLILVGISAVVYFAFWPKDTGPKTIADDPDLITTASGLKYKDLVVGTGQEAKAGDTPVVNYTAWLEDGTKINSTLDGGKPYEFPLGQKKVLPGWDEGVTGMRVGGKRKLVIPPNLAYGDTGAAQIIPKNATLIFEVELLSIK